MLWFSLLGLAKGRLKNGFQTAFLRQAGKIGARLNRRLPKQAARADARTKEIIAPAEKRED